MTDDSLIDAAFKDNRHNQGNWYTKLEPGSEAKVFIDTIVNRIIESGEEPNFAAVSRILEANFDTPVSSDSVRKHLRRVVKETRNG